MRIQLGRREDKYVVGSSRRDDQEVVVSSLVIVCNFLYFGFLEAMLKEHLYGCFGYRIGIFTSDDNFIRVLLLSPRGRAGLRPLMSDNTVVYQLLEEAR